MLRSIGKQSLESVLKKKGKATVGRICRKGRFQAWNERGKGWWMISVCISAPLWQIWIFGLFFFMPNMDFFVQVRIGPYILFSSCKWHRLWRPTDENRNAVMSKRLRDGVMCFRLQIHSRWLMKTHWRAEWWSRSGSAIRIAHPNHDPAGCGLTLTLTAQRAGYSFRNSPRHGWSSILPSLSLCKAK